MEQSKLRARVELLRAQLLEQKRLFVQSEGREGEKRRGEERGREGRRGDGGKGRVEERKERRLSLSVCLSTESETLAQILENRESRGLHLCHAL